MSRVRQSTPQADAAGSPPNGEPVFLAVGKLRRPHGVHGEMLMEVLTDFPERLKPGMVLLAGPTCQPLSLVNLRWHQKCLLVSFAGFTTPEAVGDLRNQVLYISAADRPALPEGEYYHHQLIGLQAVDEAGNDLGLLTEILETGANDVLVVRPKAGPELLLPMIDAVILNIDLVNKRLVVHLLPGMLDKAEA